MKPKSLEGDLVVGAKQQKRDVDFAVGYGPEPRPQDTARGTHTLATENRACAPLASRARIRPDAVVARNAATGYWTELHRLIKIDPPAIPEHTERREELHA